MTTQSPTKAAADTNKSSHEKLMAHIDNALNAFKEVSETGAAVADNKVTEMATKVENLLNAIRSFKSNPTAKPAA